MKHTFGPPGALHSPRYDVRGGKLLTDRRILFYIKEGRYGPSAQARVTKPQTTKPRMKKTTTLSSALACLNEIR